MPVATPLMAGCKPAIATNLDPSLRWGDGRMKEILGTSARHSSEGGHPGSRQLSCATAGFPPSRE